MPSFAASPPQGPLPPTQLPNRLRPCPQCATPGVVAEIREAGPSRLVSCPACGHEWEEAGAEEAMGTLRDQAMLRGYWHGPLPSQQLPAQRRP
jgi:hypothetical protein